MRSSTTADSAANTTPFLWSVRVYHEDMDDTGVVYHARYLHFFERARTEWLRAAGITQSELLLDPAVGDSVVFTVSDMQLQFHAPARLDDLLEIGTLVSQFGAASVRLTQQLWRVGEQRQLLCSAQVRVASIDAHRWRPVRLPAAMREQLNNTI